LVLVTKLTAVLKDESGGTPVEDVGHVQAQRFDAREQRTQGVRDAHFRPPSLETPAISQQVAA